MSIREMRIAPTEIHSARGHERHNTSDRVDLRSLAEWLGACARTGEVPTELFELVHQPMVLREALRKTRTTGRPSRAPRYALPEAGSAAEAAFIVELAAELRSGRYQPQPHVFRVLRKPRGGTRRIAVPCARDRVVARALLFVLTPIVEEHLSDRCYGFRPARGPAAAVDALVCALKHRPNDCIAIHADIKRAFDSVDRGDLRKKLSGIATDKRSVNLALALAAPPSMRGRRPIEAGRGLLQGCPISPALFNLALTDADRNVEGAASRLGGSFVRYADNLGLVVPDERASTRLMSELEQVIGGLGMQLHEIRIARAEHGFTFLGHNLRRVGQGVRTRPSADRVNAFLDEVRLQITSHRAAHGNEEVLIHELINKLLSWNYFTRTAACFDLVAIRIEELLSENEEERTHLEPPDEDQPNEHPHQTGHHQHEQIQINLGCSHSPGGRGLASAGPWPWRKEENSNMSAATHHENSSNDAVLQGAGFDTKDGVRQWLEQLGLFFTVGRPNWAIPDLGRIDLAHLGPAGFSMKFASCTAWCDFVSGILGDNKVELVQVENEKKFYGAQLRRKLKAAGMVSKDDIADAITTDPGYQTLAAREQTLQQVRFKLTALHDKLERDLRVLSRLVEVKRQELILAGKQA